MTMQTKSTEKIIKTKNNNKTKHVIFMNENEMQNKLYNTFYIIFIQQKFNKSIIKRGKQKK